VDHDGLGTILTTAPVPAQSQPQPGWNEKSPRIGAGRGAGRAQDALAGRRPANDHTDGHVDNLARFVAPGVVACPIALGTGAIPTPRPMTPAARATLAAMTDAGTPAEGSAHPLAGLVVDAEGERPIPASHMNFLIANGAVIVPTYGDAAAGELAVEALARRSSPIMRSSPCRRPPS
jgi:agmatine deiminase